MIMKKMNYVAPATALYRMEGEGMMALSTRPGAADPDKEVLVRQENWDIWRGR